MALIERNPQKNFRFALELDGIDSLLVQKITAPEVGFEEVVHGTPGDIPNLKSPGKPMVTDLVLEKILPNVRSDFDLWRWYEETQLGLPTAFKSGAIRELRPAGRGDARRFVFTGAHVGNLNQSDFEAVGSDNLLEICTIRVHVYIPELSTFLKSIYQV